MNLIKFILLLSFFLSLNAYQDIEELANAYKVRKTIETLEKLKTLYPINSTPYIKIQKLENYFMKNLPISAYSTYVKIKLHNIIDESEEYENKKNKQRKQDFLTPNTNLNYLYQKKMEEIKEQKRKSELSNLRKQIELSPTTINNPIYQKEMQKLKQNFNFSF